ncbi:hypothetical protein Pth03_18140 [Planotetraspora thailandica]|uniref:non-specific serine/threonine protein kinase n=1 Tax=Planotetraspora thailandica TaxID=487172 RepID=A0A8J3UZE2_9ACTN|nr:hypothetical protein Pth03_18140 [Planotetraspora thailandica]
MVAEHLVLAGRYELLTPLGRGGMGQVWEAEDQRLGRRVAVKLLTDEVLAGRAEPNDLVRRFAREASVMAGLQHPGVPAVHDAGTYDGGLFLVLELIEGCTLGDLVAEEGALPVAWAAGIAAQMAAVLASAHGRRFVHRDVKPQNVMLTRDGTVKVLDFGVAAVLDEAGVTRITSTGETIGTLAYMAPEQLHSKDATPSTDLYALGCVLYELLAGRPAFEATSPGALIHKHLLDTPAPLGREDVPPELEALVMQLLEKEPERRPSGARETYDRLLPHVTQPKPLGDVDPDAAGRSGMLLYSRVLVRLSRLEPAEPYVVSERSTTGGRPRGARWTFVHSLWLAPTLLFGLGTWMSFAYIAARHRRLSWLLMTVAYLVAAVTGFTLLGTSPEVGLSEGETAQGMIGLFVVLLVWPAGFLHALWINVTTRLPLRAQMEAAR